MRFNRIAFFATLFSILCLGGLFFKVWADDEIETYGQPETHDFVQHRTYIGVFGTSADIDSNNQFNGQNSYLFAPVTSTSSGATVISNEELDYIPAINRNFGFAGMAGHREGPWAAEVSYWYSNHTGTIDTVDVNNNPVTYTRAAVFSTINVDLKRYFFTSLPTQPFIDLGMNFAFLSSQNTSEVFNPNTNPASLVGIGNQTDSGVGLNLGAGLEIYLGDGFSLVGGVVQRFTTWSQITGAGKLDETPTPLNDPNNLTGSLEGNGLNFYVGTTIGIDQ